MTFVFAIESQHTGLGVFLKETSFHGVMLDRMISGDTKMLKILKDIVTEGISAGVVRPLPRTVFPDTEVEQAFRYSCDGDKLVRGHSTRSYCRNRLYLFLFAKSCWTSRTLDWNMIFQMLKTQLQEIVF
jgi:hypothetical protein